MDQGIIRTLEHKYRSHLVCKFLQRSTAAKECYKISLFDAISMLPAPWNAFSQETFGNCYEKTRFCETSEPHNEEDDDSEVSSFIWEDVQEKVDVTFTYDEYVEADDNPLPCAVHKTDSHCTEDKNTETDDGEVDTPACKPISKRSEAMQCLHTYHHFVSGYPDVPQPVVKNAWILQHFNSDLFKKQVKQIMLDIFFNKE
jgi:hypothetical protein